MAKRKHISDRKRAAIFALALGDIPYDDAKQMTEDQILSLYHLDHNMLHSSEHKDRDAFWNFTPTLIKAHRAKTKQDAKIIAKSRRIRAWNEPRIIGGATADGLIREIKEIKPRKLRSRGFDKTLRKKIDGTVVKREP